MTIHNFQVFFLLALPLISAWCLSHVIAWCLEKLTTLAKGLIMFIPTKLKESIDVQTL